MKYEYVAFVFPNYVFYFVLVQNVLTRLRVMRVGFHLEPYVPTYNALYSLIEVVRPKKSK